MKRRFVMKKLISAISIILSCVMLLNIAVIAQGTQQDNTPSKPVLDKALEQKIREDFVDYFNQRTSYRHSIDLNGVRVAGYYGNYNGYEAVYMSVGVMSTMVVDSVEIAGYRFSFASPAHANNFVVYKDSNFITVKEAYHKGLISARDVYDIGVIRGSIDPSKVAPPEDTTNPNPGDPNDDPPVTNPVLDEELKYNIRKEFLYYFRSRGNNYDPINLENIQVVGYYGSYKGYEAVEIYVDSLMYLDVIETKNIAGYTFSFSAKGLSAFFLVYKDSNFYTVEVAYNRGFISARDVYDIGVIRGDIDPDKVQPPIEETIPFIDVIIGSWYYDAVDFVYRHKIFTGIGDDQFAPELIVTRAMVAQVLWANEGSPTNNTNPFTDVPENAWFTEAISWASSVDLVEGVGDNRFDPDSPITREQLFTILLRYAEYKGVEINYDIDLSYYNDVEKVSDYAANAMRWAVKNRLITGIEKGEELYLDSKGYGTRAQLAVILMKFFDLL